MDIAQNFHYAYFDGYLALCIAKLFALSVVNVIVYWKCRGWNFSFGQKRTFFGFRWALALLTLNALINVVYESLGGTKAIISVYFHIFWLIGLPIKGIAEAITAYALVKVVLYPLRTSRIPLPDKGVAYGAAALSTVGSLTFTVSESYWVTQQIMNKPGTSGEANGSESSIYSLAMIDSGVHTLVGAVGLGAVLYTYTELLDSDPHPSLKRAIRLMMVATSAWVSSALVSTVLIGMVENQSLPSANPDEMNIVIASLDVFEAIVVSLLFALCFRYRSNAVPK